MSNPVACERQGDIAVVSIDNPPVNALSAGIRDAVVDAVILAAADPAVVGVVLTGRGRHFAAGADLRGFDEIWSREAALERSEHVHRLLITLEDSPKPVVAAIRGLALGGGLELAMACHSRVASPDAQVGQPEVSLGLIPGAGGTQRLPRLVDPETAVRMCTEGKPLTAAAAAHAGLIDRLDAGDVLSAGVALARELATASSWRRTRTVTISPHTREAARLAIARWRGSLESRKDAAAARLALAALEWAYSQPFDEGAGRERELFAEALLSTESRALRHLFFAEREAARPRALSRAAPALDIRSAAVIGAGTMGVGIAMCYASSGIPVLLKEVSDEALAKGVATIRRNYQASVSKGRITEADCARALSLITTTTAWDRFDTVDIVVEAAFEDMNLKRGIFATLGASTRGDCVLASNTSTLDIDALAEASGRPSRVVGHHFFSPANVMKLLEIVRGRETSEAVIATSLAIGKRIGKICAVVGNCFGFVANRMLAYYMREAYLLLEEGATVEQIDRAIVDFGLPVGPFAMQDIAGIDVGARIRQHLAAMGKTRADGPQSEVPDRLFEMGRYGQKTSAGWYRYDQGSRVPIPDPVVNEIASAAAARRGIDRRASITDDEIVARVTTALANEGVRVLEEGYASRAGDIDVIYCYGFGFPRYRGGPMFYAQTIGLDAVLSRVKDYRGRFGDYWRPAGLLERLVADGRSLYDASYGDIAPHA
jgi:3-hydroxyacyl-CoA dehydrogenase